VEPGAAWVPLEKDLPGFVAAHLPAKATSRQAGRDVPADADLVKLLALQRFYRQLAWSAIFTANQFQGEYVSSPRYVVVSPDWARFYNLEVAFAGERPLDREQLKKKGAADQETALAVLGQGGGSPASPGSLARAFDALAQVAEQGWSVYNQGGFIPLQRWARWLVVALVGGAAAGGIIAVAAAPAAVSAAGTVSTQAQWLSFGFSMAVAGSYIVASNVYYPKDPPLYVEEELAPPGPGMAEPDGVK